MTTADATGTVRDGGLGVWAPSITPGIGRELTPKQQLACAFRILAGNGFCENIAGHITMMRDDGPGMYVNPWGLWWEEVKASDICVVDDDAAVLEGKWDVTPAIHIHTELHRTRADARVVVHNHPYHVTALAAVGMLPELHHQTGAMFDGDIVMVHEYDGEVDTPELGSALAAQIGEASIAILANHGIIVTAPTIQEATYKASSIDRVCRLAYDIAVLGRQPLHMPKGAMVGMKKSLIERGTDVFWAGAVRSLIRKQPEVLE